MEQTLNTHELETLCQACLDCRLTRQEEQELLLVLLSCPEHDTELIRKTRQALAIETICSTRRTTSKRAVRLTLGRVAAIVAIVFSLSAAAVINYSSSPKAVKVVAKTPTTVADTAVAELFVFDNVEMQEVASILGKHYNVEPVFESEDAKHVRLYFKVEKDKNIAEVVKLLNHFSKVSVTLRDKQLFIK